MYITGKDELDSVKKSMSIPQYFRYGGPQTQAFEQDWAKRIDSKTAYVTTSGTSALIVCLQAMGIGPGDSVLVPAFTFISTALAVTSVGAIPIYTEVDETLAICPIDIEKKIRRHTAAILPVHMHGMPCNMKAIMKIARKHKLKVLEDCCQAAGGSYDKKALGSHGNMGAFSFNQFKILSCGEGGAIVTSNKKLGERAYMAQDGSCCVWPQTGKMSEAFYCSGNYRGNDMTSGILNQQLKRLDGILKDLRGTRKRVIKGLKLPKGARFVKSNDEAGNCGVCCVIQADTVELIVKISTILAENDLGNHQPINSGRHIYKHWDVINEKIGGHHPDWDCFRHPKNKNIKTNYDNVLKKSDDFLTRSLIVTMHYNFTAKKTDAMIKKINKALKEI
ncbi:MAG: aminotransferase class I/II-fold pyridoxal phosphate-dependent enzyme [Lentisphaeria bacterium]|nr:aminotransferase class I/II-fold pyridoxal phosphate-dependent enzyme [Lentisphaeria bacterium]NQZ67245.1 aminotransferase class I/II-fold pyridoxal phosphate-dependent enzyme [Lentisphaeria bacterium]